jgi:hypothetical protein
MASEALYEHVLALLEPQELHRSCNCDDAGRVTVLSSCRSLRSVGAIEEGSTL